MTTHISTERIHDWLDGELSAAEEEGLRRHLDGCPGCRRDADALASVLDGLRGLPREAAPRHELWGAIQARIAGTMPGGREAEVIPLPVEAAASPGPRRVSLTLPQLYAAGIALALLSGGAVWMALGGRTAGPLASLPTPDAPAAFVSTTTAGARQLESAVADLQQVLEEGRDYLAPETLATVEESLAAVDRAIGEAREALAADPGSDLLTRLLLNHQKTKLRILRQATAELIPAA